MTAVTKTEIERITTEHETVVIATVTRRWRKSWTGRVSEASARRLSRASESRYISRWPNYKGGWFANLYVPMMGA